MSRFIFYQVAFTDGDRAFYGKPLDEPHIRAWLEGKEIYAGCSVLILGEMEYTRLMPIVSISQTAQPTDREDSEAAQYAIQLAIPKLSERAEEKLKELDGAFVLFFYMEHFVLTDEGCDLDKPLWEGDSLEEMERWLEQQASAGEEDQV